MITTYIFDFGNVLANFYPEKLTEPYVSDEEERKYLASIVFDRAVWDKLDDGTYSDEEAKAEICKNLPAEKHEVACRIYDGWIDNLTPVPGMTELIEDIRKQGDKKLYLLSNISRGFAANFGKTPWIRDLFANFDGLVLTGTLGIVKPTKEIFEYMFKTYGLRAEECLFVDDSEKNIRGAVAVGINGYLFDGDAQRLKKELGL